MFEKPNHIRCPNDAALIPRVDKEKLWPICPWRFYWCRWCEELFAFLVESDQKRFVARFSYDKEKMVFLLRHFSGSEEEMEQVQAAAASLGFKPKGSG